MHVGNKPPWTLPAKAAYGKYDSARAKQYFNLPSMTTPSFFPILSLLPQRTLVYIKEAYPQLFTTAFLAIFHAMWEKGLDVSKPELLSQVLATQFNDSEVQTILEKGSSAAYKQRLNANTQEALDRGAFGCPWFFVRNSKGEEEPFFGSDRYVSTPSRYFLAGVAVFGIAPVRGRGRRLNRAMRTMKHSERKEDLERGAR
jgi:glutathione S-transferase kappa 1